MNKWSLPSGRMLFLSSLLCTSHLSGPWTLLAGISPSYILNFFRRGAHPYIFWIHHHCLNEFINLLWAWLYIIDLGSSKSHQLIIMTIIASLKRSSWFGCSPASHRITCSFNEPHTLPEALPIPQVVILYMNCWH